MSQHGSSRHQIAPSGSALPPFPEVAWQSRLFAGYRGLVSPTTEAAEPLVFGAFLASLSFLVAPRCGLRWGPKTEKPIVQVALLGRTGRDRKSTALQDAIDIVAEPLRPRSTDGREPDLSSIAVGMGSGEGLLALIADREFEDGGTRRTQRGRSLLLGLHELGEVLAKIERGQAGALHDFLLNAFDGRSSWTLQLKVGKLIATDAVAVVAGASTYEWLLEQLQPAMVGAGLLNRWLLFTGERRGPLALRPAIAASAVEAFQADVAQALAAVGRTELRLDDAAARLHEAHYARAFTVQPAHALADAATARTDAHALRLSMLFAVGDASAVIRPEHVEAAWQVAEYSAAIAEDLVEQIGARSLRDSEERIMRAAEKAAIQGDGSFSRREIWQRLKGKSGMSRETFLRAWDGLVGAEDIVPSDATKTRWRLNDAERITQTPPIPSDDPQRSVTEPALPLSEACGARPVDGLHRALAAAQLAGVDVGRFTAITDLLRPPHPPGPPGPPGDAGDEGDGRDR